MQALIIAILTYATPIITKAIADYRAAHNGQTPTDADIIATLHANVEAGNSEWAQWLAAHPET
jgi:hypothetical protein